MSEVNEENEILLLLKALVDKVNKLETAVFNNDNILMKSGYVVVDTPTPIMATSTGKDVDEIAKMDWNEIGQLVAKLEGEY